MRRVLVLLVLLAACARSSRGPVRASFTPFERPPLRVGDRSVVDSVIDQWVTTEDGTYKEYRSSIRENEILQKDGVRITKMRVEVRKLINLVDGESRPQVLGNFVVTQHGSELEVTKFDGSAIEEAESAYVRRVSENTFLATGQRDELFSRTFQIGASVRLSPLEATRLGFSGRGAIDLTLTDVRSSVFVVSLSGATKIGELRNEYGERVSGQIEISRSGPYIERWKFQITFFDETGDVGRSDQRLEYQLISGAKR